jgi:hypothetical protein
MDSSCADPHENIASTGCFEICDDFTSEKSLVEIQTPIDVRGKEGQRGVRGGHDETWFFLLGSMRRSPARRTEGLR